MHVAADAVEVAGLDARVEEQAPQRRVKDALGQRRLAAAAHARDAGHDAQRNPHVDVAQVVLTRPWMRIELLQPRSVAGALSRGARQVVGREALPALSSWAACR